MHAKPMERRIPACLLAALALGTAGGTAWPADYPERPVRLIVPTSAGGGTDILARSLAQHLAQPFGQQVVVDNRPGAGSVIGTQIAASAAPDGHTLLMVTPSFAINPGLRPKLPYDSGRDLVPISEVASVQNVLLVVPGLGVRDAQALAKLLRSNPGKYNYASGGFGTPPHMAFELLKSMGGFDVVHIAFKGSGPALAALSSNQVSVMINGAPPALPLIKSGRLVPLAVTGRQRWEQFPTVPTVSEAMVPGYEAVTWFGLLAPRGTPAGIVDRVNEAVRGVLAKPDLATTLVNQGFRIVGSRPEAFAERIREDTAKFKAVVEKGRLTLKQ